MRAIDGGNDIDWGKASGDYALHRPGYPGSFYERLAAVGVGPEGQRILDLGTGTGVLARAFAARGARVSGIDISPGQVETARRLAMSEGLSIDFRVAPAESTPFPPASFDLLTAGQCWLYFDKARATEEARRLLAPGGALLTCHLCWLPRIDPIARATEKLVLEHNPRWSGSDWSGNVPAHPGWAAGHFRVRAMFFYDLALPFTREAWRGRIRACRGVGATLSPEEVRRFDAEHAALLEAIAPERFTVLHRIDAHVFEPE